MYLRMGLVVLIIYAFLFGCQQNNDQESLQMNDQNNDTQQLTNVRNSDPGEVKNLSNEDIAIHLANVASDVPNVNDAASIVAGPYAVVGIDVDEDLDRSRVGTIKYSVTEALQHDPYGKTAVVVADADIMERLRSMGRKIEEGYPVQGVVDELAAIVGRYMPEFPINDDQPVEPDQNKEIIPEEDRERLDDIEKDQSNESNE